MMGIRRVARRVKGSGAVRNVRCVCNFCQHLMMYLPCGENVGQTTRNLLRHPVKMSHDCVFLEMFPLKYIFFELFP